jgi:tetratricopeptide (TPR) repeat protein
VRGDPHAAVRVALAHSYAALPAGAQRLFRLLGLVPGPHFTAPAAAALANLPRTQAAQLLDLLAAAHLVDEHAVGRYSFHDLIRRYAAEMATTADSKPDRTAALARLFDHYLHAVAAAGGHMYPQLMRLPLPSEPTPAASFPDLAHAAAWLDAERPNLVAAVIHAAEHGPAAAAWRLADAMRGYLYTRMYTVDWLAVARAGLAAAEADGDPGAQAASQIGLASLHWVQGRHGQAVDHFTRALRLAREAAWVDGESAVLGNLGNLYWALGQLDNAATHYVQALALHRQTGQVASEATALGNLGLVYFGLGRPDLAADQYALALPLHGKTGSRSGEARTLTHLGDAYHAMGRLDEAATTLTEALDVLRVIGARNVEGDTTRNLAAVLRDAGRYDEALRLANAAVDLARDTGDRRLEAGALTTKASIHHQLGKARPAMDGYRRAVGIAHAADNRYIEVEALIGLATAEQRAGDLDAATGRAREALTIARNDGYGLLERQCRELLAAMKSTDKHQR